MNAWRDHSQRVDLAHKEEPKHLSMSQDALEHVSGCTRACLRMQRLSARAAVDEPVGTSGSKSRPSPVEAMRESGTWVKTHSGLVVLVTPAIAISPD